MRIFTFFIFLSCFSQAYSQDPSKLWIGIMGAPEIVTANYLLGFRNPVIPYDSNYTKRLRVGGSFGLFVSKTIKERWAVQVGLQYSTNGDRILSDITAAGPPNANGFHIIQTAFESHYHWLSIPVRLNYSFIVQKKIQVYFSASVAPSFLVRESKVSQFYLDNGGDDRNNLASGYSSLQMRPGVIGGLGVRIKVSYRWVATIEPEYHGILQWSGLNYASMLNSYGISLGMWKAI